VARALVIGYGSIGRRHARLLAAMGHEVAVVTAQAGCDFPALDGGADDRLTAFDADYVVIAKPTAEHAAWLRRAPRLAPRGIVLVEKPLYASPAEHDGAIRTQRVAVGYNLRFHPVVAWLHERFAGREFLRARFVSVSYLPDWRPGRDYRATSSAARASGGGVLRDLSHELDLARHFLGPWRRATALGGHRSRLEIETEDIVEILGEAERCGIVSVQLSYAERHERRSIELVTDEVAVYADLIGGTVEVNGRTAHRSGPVDIDATYSGMHMAALAQRGGPLCTYGEALDTLRLIDAAERSLAAPCWTATA
jgi:predicted dehydrogenase